MAQVQKCYVSDTGRQIPQVKSTSTTKTSLLVMRRLVVELLDQAMTGVQDVMTGPLLVHLGKELNKAREDNLIGRVTMVQDVMTGPGVDQMVKELVHDTMLVGDNEPDVDIVANVHVDVMTGQCLPCTLAL